MSIEKRACTCCGAPPIDTHVNFMNGGDGSVFQSLCKTCNARARKLMAEMMTIVKSPWVHFRGFIDDTAFKD